MKQAVYTLAVFLSLTTAAQKSGFPVKNEIPVYKPVKVEFHRIFNYPSQINLDDLDKLKEKIWKQFANSKLHSMPQLETGKGCFGKPINFWDSFDNASQWMVKKIKGIL